MNRPIEGKTEPPDKAAGVIAQGFQLTGRALVHVLKFFGENNIHVQLGLRTQGDIEKAPEVSGGPPACPFRYVR